MPKGMYTKTKEHCKKVWESRRRNGTDKHSEETRRKLSLTHIGLRYPKRKSVKFTQERKDKIRKIALEKGYGKWMLGRKLSVETRKKMSKALKGKVGWTKGLTKETDIRLLKAANLKRGRRFRTTEQYKEDAKKIVVTRKKNNSYAHSEATKDKLRKTIQNLYDTNPEYRTLVSQKVKEKMWEPETRERYLKSLTPERERKIFSSFKDTSIETKLHVFLENNNIQFEKHYPILGHPDIFIKPNICIFADGCYWHKCSECGYEGEEKRQKDQNITRELQKQGYLVIRIWEHQINNNELDLLKKNIPLV